MNPFLFGTSMPAQSFPALPVATARSATASASAALFTEQVRLHLAVVDKGGNPAAPDASVEKRGKIAISRAGSSDGLPRSSNDSGRPAESAEPEVPAGSPLHLDGADDLPGNSASELGKADCLTRSNASGQVRGALPRARSGYSESTMPSVVSADPTNNPGRFRSEVHFSKVAARPGQQSPSHSEDRLAVGGAQNRGHAKARPSRQTAPAQPATADGLDKPVLASQPTTTVMADPASAGLLGFPLLVTAASAVVAHDARQNASIAAEFNPMVVQRVAEPKAETVVSVPPHQVPALATEPEAPSPTTRLESNSETKSVSPPKAMAGIKTVSQPAPTQSRNQAVPGNGNPGTVAVSVGGMAGAPMAPDSAVPDAQSRPAFSSGANLFAQLDIAGVQSGLSYSGAGTTLQVGIPDAVAGAAGVRAHLAGGQVTASIQVEREPALHGLTRELPALQQFLAESHVEIKHVSVDLSHRGTGGVGQDAGEQPNYGQSSSQSEKRDQESAARGAAPRLDTVTASNSPVGGGQRAEQIGDGVRNKTHGSSDGRQLLSIQA